MKKRRVLSDRWRLREEESGTCFPIPHMPMQVHEILYENGKIDSSYLWGKTKHCRWVNEKTWIYETDFCCEEHALLLLEGLDTFCSIRLNGIKIGESRDCYLPMRIPISPFLERGNNHLELIFTPVERELERVRREYAPLLERTSVQARSFLRKTLHDFTTYLGNDEDFYKVGVFRPVFLETIPEGVMLEEIKTRYTLSESLESARLTAVPLLYMDEDAGKPAKAMSVKLNISIDGQSIWSGEKPAGEAFEADLGRVRLWWPRGYGEQPLYDISAELYERGENSKEEELIDRKSIRIGFRKIQMQGMLNFVINGMPVKLWGANLTPDEGHTLCENTERMERLLRLALDANLNSLRIWGEGVPLSDFLYDYADEHGLLLWQEFFCGHMQYPMCREVTDLILREAEQMIRSRGHHPSILLWCGGNECYLSRDFAAPGEEYLAAAFFEYELKELCGRLDPDRYYHVSSPFYGKYTNEPSLGDTHSYTNSWYVPGSDIPVFASENLRVCFPVEQSLKRYLQTETLPQPTPQGHGDLPWPQEYERITSAESWKKIPPVEQFYDASTPQEMIYRFGMAAGQYIQDSVERYRRGKRAYESLEPRRCMGHFIWKWNTTFPHIYSSMIDAYLEPKLPYYFLKRACSPILLSIEAGDHLHVWAVNDTAGTLRGEARLALFDMEDSRFIKTASFPFCISPGESAVLGRLDSWGQMTRDKIVWGELRDGSGRVLAQTHRFLDIERHITFPDAKITLRQDGSELVLSSDRFARCVELGGVEQEDSYWWDFSDNYFDLFPGREKRIRIAGKHKKGIVRAKGFYSTYAAELFYRSGS